MVLRVRPVGWFLQGGGRPVLPSLLTPWRQTKKTIQTIYQAPLPPCSLNVGCCNVHVVVVVMSWVAVVLYMDPSVQLRNPYPSKYVHFAHKTQTVIARRRDQSGLRIESDGWGAVHTWHGWQPRIRICVKRFAGHVSAGPALPRHGS